MDQCKEKSTAEVHDEDPAQAEEPKAGPAAAKKTSPMKKPVAPALVTSGGTRERKKVEHFKPAEVSETKRLVVKEVRR